MDLDISCRLRENGYRILQVDYTGLLHEIGDGKWKYIFGHRVWVTHHSPTRNYYARRNIIYVARKHYSGNEKRKQILLQLKYAIGVCLLEDKKLSRIKHNIKGIVDGFRMPL